MPEYSEEILDSNSISSTDKAGRPIPVTIPIALAPGIKVVYTTRLGGLSTGDYGNLNLGGKSGDEPEAVLSNRIALAEAVQARLSLVSQVHSGVAVDVDDSFVINTPFGFDVSGTHGETDTPHVIEAGRPGHRTIRHRPRHVRGRLSAGAAGRPGHRYHRCGPLRPSWSGARRDRHHGGPDEEQGCRPGEHRGHTRPAHLRRLL